MRGQRLQCVRDARVLLAARRVLTVAAKLDRLAFLFAVLATVSPMGTAFFDHALARGVGALCRIGHGEPPGEDFTRASRFAAGFRIPVWRPIWMTTPASTAACSPPPRDSCSSRSRSA